VKQSIIHIGIVLSPILIVAMFCIPLVFASSCKAPIVPEPDASDAQLPPPPALPEAGAKDVSAVFEAGVITDWCPQACDILVSLGCPEAASYSTCVTTLEHEQSTGVFNPHCKEIAGSLSIATVQSFGVKCIIAAPAPATSSRSPHK
jgi:hypothetical protein